MSIPSHIKIAYEEVGPLPDFLTRSQVARLCRVTPSAVYQWNLPVTIILGTPMVAISEFFKSGAIRFKGMTGINTQEIPWQPKI
jgi:hypothetical protein